MPPVEYHYCCTEVAGCFLSVTLLYKITLEFCLGWNSHQSILTLNVPGDCGSARPTRVEPRLHCVGIAWQVRGKCADSAAHSPLRAITARALSAARAIEPRPTHSARVPRTWRSAHFAGHAKCGSRTVRPDQNAGPCADSLANAICDPANLPPSQITAKTINHVTFLSEQQPYHVDPVMLRPSVPNYSRETNTYVIERSLYYTKYCLY